MAAFAVVASLWAGSYAGSSLVVSRELRAPDMILVLASHEWERLPEAADLARRSPGAVVALTEPAAPTPYNCHLCAERPAWLASMGVAPARVVVLPRRVTNTLDEARSAREFARLHGVGSLLVVTSPYHTRRAAAAFGAVFADTATIIGVHPAFAHSPARPDAWWTSPYDRAYVRYEWAALLWYTLRHRVDPRASAGIDAAQRPSPLAAGTSQPNPGFSSLLRRY